MVHLNVLWKTSDGAYNFFLLRQNDLNIHIITFGSRVLFCSLVQFRRSRFTKPLVGYVEMAFFFKKKTNYVRGISMWCTGWHLGSYDLAPVQPVTTVELEAAPSQAHTQRSPNIEGLPSNYLKCKALHIVPELLSILWEIFVVW